MAGIYEYDPVKVLEGYCGLAIDLIETAAQTAGFCAFDLQIAKMQNEQKTLKLKFAIDKKKAKESSPADWVNIKKGLREKLDQKAKEIEDKKIQKDKFHLSILYAIEGIHVLFDDIMSKYGLTAAKFPSIRLKGTGDIILNAGKSRNIYVSGAMETGSPTGAINETFNKISIGAKILKVLIKWPKDIANFKKEKKEVW